MQVLIPYRLTFTVFIPVNQSQTDIGGGVWPPGQLQTEVMAAFPQAVRTLQVSHRTYSSSSTFLDL